MIDIKQVAQVIHEANKAFGESIGESHHVSWEKTPESQKKISIGVVKNFIENKYKMTPEEVHKNWLEDKIKQGWKWGPGFNPITRLNPNLVPYDQLNLNEKMKDYLVRNIIAAFHRCYGK
jgi:hypothetical protein